MIDPTRSLLYNITIQCSLDGFCFVIHDIEENKIIDIELYQTSEAGDECIVMEALEKTLFKKDLYEKPFHSVRFIVGNRLNTLVPTELFDNQHPEVYFRFNHDLPSDHILMHEALPAINSVNVFAIPAQQRQRVLGLWNNAVIIHQSTVFLNSILHEAPAEDSVTAYVNVNSRSFDMAIAKECNILFFNNFKFNTKDDFIYFLIFALEQQQLDSQETPICFTGLISGNSEIIRLCERYIKHLRFIRPDGSVNVDMSLNATPFQYYYIPYKSITCES